MSIWKQALLSLVILLAAAFGWVKFFPGAHDILARNGLGWISVAVANTPSQPEQPATQRPAAAGQGQGQGQNRGGQQVGVVTADVGRATINDRLTAIGTGRSNQSVVVIPFAAGRLTEVVVKSGATVAAGDVIARLDAENESIASDRAEVALADARSRLERIETLRRTNTASQVQVTEVELAVQNAELELRTAELALERRAITAPIAGVVGIVPVTPGNYVTTQTEIATIDDRSEIIVDFFVPERFSGIASVGSDLTASLVARPSEVFEGKVSAVDNRIDEQSRTLRMQARIQNPEDTLRAGMSFRVEMRFPGDSYPSVDPLAVQWGADGAFVWAVRDGRAERVPVRIIQRNTEAVLVDAALGEQDVVVTQGIHAVRQGAPVMIARSSGGAIPDSVPLPAPATAASGT